MTTEWERDLGTSQGRIASASAPEGSYVYELGDALFTPHELRIGDYHEIQQTLTLDGAAKLLRATVRFRPPPTIPAGFRWLFTMRLNGAVLASREIKRDAQTIELDDLAVPLFTAGGPPGTDVVAFRLEVVL
jgi:hypothetical protein